MSRHIHSTKVKKLIKYFCRRNKLNLIKIDVKKGSIYNFVDKYTNENYSYQESTKYNIYLKEYPNFLRIKRFILEDKLYFKYNSQICFLDKDNNIFDEYDK